MLQKERQLYSRLSTSITILKANSMKLVEETVAIINPFIQSVESLLDRIIVLQISQLHETV